MNAADEFELVVGLEVHAQLLTRTKIFSADSVVVADPPNSHAGLVTLAHPGTLPQLNLEVIKLALRMGLACHCEIAGTVTFDRKNYFYPDLPKGFQITQDRNPICKSGYVELPGGTKIQLNRIHLEEDAGKSIHDPNSDHSILDFNRAGTPLIEMVTEPCIHSAEEAGQFMTEVRSMLRYLGICDGNMEEGSLRADANVSVRRRGDAVLGRKVEIKNMNSIRNLKVAIESEYIRQIECLKGGGTVISETRQFDVATGHTTAMRQKEELNDYRYFPEPDLSPYIISENLIRLVEKEMPRTGAQYEKLFKGEYGLPEYDARVISSQQETALYFLEVSKHCTDYKTLSNWVMGPVLNIFNQNPGAGIPVAPEKLAALIELVNDEKVSHTTAVQKLFPALLDDHTMDPLQFAQKNGWLMMGNEDELLVIIRDILRIYPLKVEEFKKGKKGILAMFMGEVMKRTKGKADPKKANELFTNEIDKLN